MCTGYLSANFTIISFEIIIGSRVDMVGKFSGRARSGTFQVIEVSLK